jgi:hypothetical protein
MSDLLDEGTRAKPCGCGEASPSASLGGEPSREELDAAVAAVEAGGAAEGGIAFEEAGELDLAGLEEGLDDLMTTPPAGEGKVTLEDLLGLLENYPGLKVTIGF